MKRAEITLTFAADILDPLTSAKDWVTTIDNALTSNIAFDPKVYVHHINETKKKYNPIFGRFIGRDDHIDAFTHLEVEAALCVWECINDWTLGNDDGDIIGPVQKAWKELRDGSGSVELRYQSKAIGRWCLKVYDACVMADDEVFGSYAYDWEVIPEIMSHLIDDEGDAVIYPQDFPAPEKVAGLVALHFKFEDFLSKARHASMAKYGCNIGSWDDPASWEAFADDREPEAFVEAEADRLGFRPIAPALRARRA